MLTSRWALSAHREISTSKLTLTVAIRNVQTEGRQGVRGPLGPPLGAAGLWGVGRSGDGGEASGSPSTASTALTTLTLTAGTAFIFLIGGQAWKKGETLRVKLSIVFIFLSEDNPEIRLIHGVNSIF